MWAKRYWAGRMWAPRFWPQSQGLTPDAPAPGVGPNGLTLSRRMTLRMS